MMKRASGVLLHISCLPNRYGIGDLGAAALDLLDWLHEAGQSVWQILPLGPVGYANSPYDAHSSFAGNPLLINPDGLHGHGLLDEEDLHQASRPESSSVDFARVESDKSKLLRKAWSRLLDRNSSDDLLATIQRWTAAAAQRTWLPDWGLYAALRERFPGRSWTEWPEPLRQRDREAIERARHELENEIHYQEFLQFLFFEQLDRVRTRAKAHGISLLGDLPFYVAMESCDVWAHAHLFDLDEARSPRTVGGVPPDYFSATGQRWGSPTYLWDRHREQAFSWWLDRLEFQLHLVGLLRLDHFRGFAGYWEIPADEPTAVVGQWRPGPGLPLFHALQARLEQLPLIAEDLGVITPDVEELRQQLQIPGMRVLQFAFDAPDSPHLPHNLSPDQVLYTGTHDNDTSRGWFDSAAKDCQRRAVEYLGATDATFCWDLLRAAQASVAHLVIAPIQDVACLDGEHRMNVPGTSDGNWQWRLPAETLTDTLAHRLRQLTEICARTPPAPSHDPGSA